MNKLTAAAAAVLLAALMITGALIFILPDREFSENENRTLAQRPQPSAEAVLSGEFQTKLTDFLSDQFPARDAFMMTGTTVKLLSGQRDIGEAYIGHDRYYFEKLTEKDIDKKRFEKNLRSLDLLAKNDPDIPFSMLLVPSSGVILHEKLPPFARMYDADAMMQTAADTLEHTALTDITEALRGHCEDYIYYRTDHHWTALGAYLGYKAIKPEGKAVYSESDKAADSFYGSLFSRTLDPRAQADSIYLPEIPEGVSVSINGEPAAVYDRAKLNEKDKYQVFFGGNFGTVDIKNGAGKGTLLVIKDSFANTLVPYLLSDYERVIMIDLRFFGGSLKSLIASENVNEVLTVYEMNNFANEQSIARAAM